MYIEFKVNNTAIDLYSFEDLPLNNVKRVTTTDNKPAGGYSKVSVTVPATALNSSVFTDSSYKDCQIYVDGVQQFSGRVQARKGKTFADSYGTIKESFKLNLFSDNSNWWLAVKDIDFSDFVTESFEVVNTAISDRFSLDTNYADNVRFGIIKRGQWSDNSTSNGLTYDRVKLIEFTPLYYIKSLLVGAFNHAGYSVESTFIDNDDFRNLVMPVFVPEKFPEAYSNKYLNGSANKGSISLNGSLASFDSLTQPTGATPFSNTPVNVGEIEIYTAPSDGFYEVTIELELEAPANFNETLNGLLCLAYPSGSYSDLIGFTIGRYILSGSAYKPYKQYSKVSRVYQLTAGDTINFQLDTNTSINIENIKVSVTGEVKYDYGVLLDFQTLLSGYKAGDFIKGLQHMFNLVFEVDEDLKKVYIEPDNNYLTTYAGSAINEGFYKNQTNTFKDISDKVDYSKKGEFEYLAIESSRNFKYKEDSEGTLDYINSTDSIRNFDASVTFENGDGKTEESENAFFAKTLMIQDLEIVPEGDRGDDTTTPTIPLICEGNYFLDPLTEQSTNIPTPRILYFFGTSTDNGEVRLLDSNNVEGTSDCPLLYSYNVNDAAGNYPHLSFSDIGNNRGLLSRYYLNFLARRNKMFVRKNYVRLYSIDLSDFSFRNKLLINSELYILQEMKGFNPIRLDSVEYTLVPDVSPDAETLDLINHSIVKSHIQLS